MDDDIKYIVVLSLISIFILGFFLGLFILYDMKIKCPQFAQAVQLEGKYSLFGGGCFVKTEKGQWVKDENYWNSPIN